MKGSKDSKQPHFSELRDPANKPLPASRHGEITPLAEDVFFVRGRMPTTPTRPLFARLFLHYSRTMTVVRDRNDEGGYDLTIFNSIRLSEQGLTSLEKLGKIKNVVRLGSFHGVDDAFYVQHYGAEYWVVDGMRSAHGLEVTPKLLSEQGSNNLPIPGADVFIFADIQFPEAIYVLPPNQNRGGVAITTDSIQNHTSIWDVDNSFIVSLAIWRIGLVGSARLGPIWLKEQTPRTIGQEDQGNRQAEMAHFFRPQFQRLLSDYTFDMLVPGHGWPIQHHAKAEIEKSIESQLSI